MKQIFILILTFSIFSCSKNDESKTLSAQKSEQDIFNAVVGTWNFNQAGYDPEFKKIFKFEIKECAAKDYNILRQDGTITRINGCWEEEETGTFEVKIGGVFDGDDNVYLVATKTGFNFVPGWGIYAAGTLYNYTDSTLLFSNITYHSDGGDIPNLYFELKRVK